MTELTELEQVTLAVVWRDGPCTPYHVRTEFQASPTEEWSGSAGTIYPLMRRLEKQGHLSSTDAERDKRGTRIYRVTPTGRRALKRWMRPPLPPAALGPGVDPIRTRLLFFEVLTPSERREFLDVVAEQLAEATSALRAAEREQHDAGDRLGTLATRGAMLVARARRDWFRAVCEELG